MKHLHNYNEKLNNEKKEFVTTDCFGNEISLPSPKKMQNLTNTQNQLIEAIKKAEDKFLYVEIGKKFKQNTIDSLLSLNAIEIHELELGGAWGDDTCYITLK